MVDDDRNIRRMLAATLDSPEQDVTEAESANAAIESLAAMPYDVVISDVRMPGMNGMQLLEEIKRRDSTMPVIMMTAFGTIPDAVEAIRLGAYDYLTKPFSAENLRRIVSRARELQNLKTEVRTLRSKLERRHIESVIQHAMTFEEAADMLGINVATLWRKRRRYGFK